MGITSARAAKTQKVSIMYTGVTLGMLKAQFLVKNKRKMIMIMKEFTTSEDYEGEQHEMEVCFVLRRKGAYKSISHDLMQKCA